MTITQRFYPKTIDSIFKTGNFFAPLGQIPVSPVIILLLKTNSGIEWDPERFEIFNSESEINDKSAYIGSKIIAAQRIGTKLNFLIPDQRWETSNNIPFQQGIICFFNGQFPAYAFLHIDFGQELNPQNGFEFNQNSSCIPCIDFSPISCIS